MRMVSYQKPRQPITGKSGSHCVAAGGGLSNRPFSCLALLGYFVTLGTM
jgi:hypothetical protein